MKLIHIILSLILHSLLLCDLCGCSPSPSASASSSSSSSPSIRTSYPPSSSSSPDHSNANTITSTSSSSTTTVDISSALASASPRPPTRFAYVTMHYEDTPKDDEYLLGLRVLIKSIQATGTPYDVVCLVSANVRPSSQRALLEDGVILKHVDNLENPFETKVHGRNTYRPRFIYSFNKLYMWALTEYERIVFLDSDNIFLHNMDSIFMCGHFCVVYMNPLLFHTGLIVVKPDLTMFNQLIHNLYADSSFSHDGADQGFLVAQFDVEHAPLFLPQNYQNGVPSEEPAMRLSQQWNLNHFFYYIAFNWEWFKHGSEPYGLSNSDIPAYSLAYCSGVMLKPWYWFPTFYFIHHFQWQYKRELLGIDYSSILYSRLIAFLPFFFIIKYVMSNLLRHPSLSILSHVLHKLVSSRPVLLGQVCGFVCFVASVAATAMCIPMTVPPKIAWPIFAVFHTSLMYLLLCGFTSLLTPRKVSLENKEEVQKCVQAVSGLSVFVTLFMFHLVFYLNFLNIFLHFIVKIATFELFIIIWMAGQMHQFRRAAVRLTALHKSL